MKNSTQFPSHEQRMEQQQALEKLGERITELAAHLDAHHIRHWADGGETNMDNLVLLCRRHHRLVHEGGFGLATNSAGKLEFTQPNGEVLPQAYETRSRGNVGKVIRTNLRNGLEITPKTPTPRWYGEKMDHELAVLGLVQKE